MPPIEPARLCANAIQAQKANQKTTIADGGTVQLRSTFERQPSRLFIRIPPYRLMCRACFLNWLFVACVRRVGCIFN